MTTSHLTPLLLTGLALFLGCAGTRIDAYDDLVVEGGRFALEQVDGDLVMTAWYPGGGMAFQGAEVDGEREGLWRAWHENGQAKMEGLYLNGRREGPWSFWMEDGTLDAEFSGTYASGRRVGP